MKVIVNEAAAELPAGSTVADLVRSRDLRSDRVVAEVNGEIVARGGLESTALNEGDRIELVHFVGGG